MDALDLFVPNKSEVGDYMEPSSNAGRVPVNGDILVESVTHLGMDAQSPPDIVVSTSAAENEEEASDRLTLAYERLFEIPKTIVDRFADHIRYLDISHNKITNLDALVYFKHLTSLIADGNPITEQCVLPPLPHLQLLWLNHCKISSLFPWVQRLQQACPRVQYLCLMGNPAAPSYLNGGTFYEYLQYRLFVISQFPSLLHLDDRAVTPEQRAEAARLYRRPLLERLLRPRGGDLRLPAWRPLRRQRDSSAGGGGSRNRLI